MPGTINETPRCWSSSGLHLGCKIQARTGTPSKQALSYPLLFLKSNRWLAPVRERCGYRGGPQIRPPKRVFAPNPMGWGNTKEDLDISIQPKA